MMSDGARPCACATPTMLLISLVSRAALHAPSAAMTLPVSMVTPHPGYKNMTE